LERILAGDSEMAGRMRGLDWSKTDLGPPGSWPVNLRTAVGICLASRAPIALWWGPDFTLLYNDACIPLMADTRHPAGLGRPGRECWGDRWGAIGPILERVRATGEPGWPEDLRLAGAAARETCDYQFSLFSLGPVLAADGGTVEGVFCAVQGPGLIDRPLFAPREAPEAGAQARNASSARVLLAEDDPGERRYLERVLAERWTVETVADGPAALEAASRRPPDLVLAGVTVKGIDGQGIDGYELARRLRADPTTREVPIILLSGGAGEGSRARGMEAGADDCLVRPFSARELIAGVQSHLRPARVRSETDRASRKSQERYRGLVDMSPDGILIYQHNCIVFLNPAALRLVGASIPEEVLGKSPFTLFHPDCHTRICAGIGRLRAAPPGPPIEAKLVRPDGTVTDVELSAAPFPGPPGTRDPDHRARHHGAQGDRGGAQRGRPPQGRVPGDPRP
jgi:PAS domain S-box-containing protein